MGEKKQALDGLRMNMFGMDPDEVVIVGRDTDDGIEHPLYRKTAHDDADPALVASIMEFGVIMPVALYKDGDRALVGAGRGRTIAAREAKKRGWEGRLPCIVLKGDDATKMSVAATENHVRRIETPLVLSEDAIRLTNGGKNPAQVAAALGVPVSRVRDLIKLGEASAPVRKAVESGALSATAGAKLASLPRDEQREAVEDLAKESGKRATVRETRKAVAKKAGREHIAALSAKSIGLALEATAELAKAGDRDLRLVARGARNALLMALGRKPEIEDEVTEAIGKAVGA